MGSAAARIAGRRWGWFAIGIPLALTLLAYLPSLRNGFVYDDVEMVVRNRYLGQWSFVWKSFLHEVWWFADPEQRLQTYYYRPLENAWLALNYHLFGINPLGWHASMIAVEVLAVWLVFLLARRLTHDLIAASIAATLFGLIPVHAGSIAWGRSIPVPMSAAFQLGALLCFVRRAEAPRRNLALALALCAGALLSHEAAFVFPGIIAVYVFLFEGAGDDAATDATRGSLRARVLAGVRAAAPFAAVVLAYAALRIWVLGPHVPVSRRNPWNALECALTVPAALWQYAMLLALPWRTGPAHELHPVGTVAGASFWLPTVALAAVGAGGWLLLRRHPHRRLYLFCAGMMLIALAPYLDLAALTPVEAIEDRYLFLPSAFWCIGLGDLAAGFIAAGGARRWIASAAAAAIAVAYAGWLLHVEPYWHDNLAYFSKCIEMSPSSWLCHADLGLELENRGDLQGAERELRTSIALRPTDGLGFANLAALHLRTNQFELAERDLLEAVRYMRPPSGAVFVELAQVADIVGDHDTSQRALEGIAMMPGGRLTAAITLARIKLHHQDYAGASAALRALQPAERDEINAWMVLGRADALQHRYDLALDDYDAALRLEPNRARLHALRAVVLARLQRPDEARAECQRALALEPGNPTAQALMAKLGAASPK